MRRNVLIILFLFLGVSYFLFRDSYDFFVYDGSRYAIYNEKSRELIVDNVVNPTMIDNDIVLGIFMEECPYIGYYDIYSKEKTILLYIDDLVAEENDLVNSISNIQYLRVAPQLVSFVIGNKLYKYKEDEGVEYITEFENNSYKKSYYWLDKDSLVLLDGPNLYKVDVTTNQKQLIDNNVIAVTVADEIIYSKKIYYDSWCEWELHFTDFDLQTTKSSICKSYLSIGNIVCGGDKKLYLTSDVEGTLKNEVSIYLYSDGFWKIKKIDKISRENELIGVITTNLLDEVWR